MRVVVIGGGVIGLSAAVECAMKGMDVTLIDSSPIERGSSLGNAGMVVPSHFVPLAAPGMVALGLKWMWNPESPFYIKPRLDLELIQWGLTFWRSATKQHVLRSAPLLRDLNLASREIYVRLSESADFGLMQRGLVMLCKEQKTLDEEGHTAEQAKELGIPAEILDAKQMAALDPDVDMDIVGGVYFPKDCHLRPEQFVRAQEARFETAGGKLRYGCRVLDFEKQGERIVSVRTNEGEIEADEFVLSGGAWSSDLGKKIGLSIPMQAGKGYSLTVENPTQLPRICSIFTEARVAVTPMGNTLRFGGTMEIAGLNTQISQRRVDGIVNSVSKYYPRFKRTDFQGIKPWFGLRPCSPDGLPYLGRPKSLKNLVVATGHSMMGLSLAPITGRLVSQLVARSPLDIAIDLLSPDR